MNEKSFAGEKYTDSGKHRQKFQAGAPMTKRKIETALEEGEIRKGTPNEKVRTRQLRPGKKKAGLKKPKVKKEKVQERFFPRKDHGQQKV